MRFLCLHGMGTSAAILEAQLSSILDSVGSQHEYVYVDGEVECGSAAGINRFYSGPYSCFYDAPTRDNLLAAFELLDEVIEQDGPFDGVIGFSQGAALASSYMLHKVKRFGDQPFKCALFICASMPFDVDSIELPPHLNPAFSREIKALGFSGMKVSAAPLLQRYTEAKNGVSITVPSCHIIGKQDMYLEQGLTFAKMCTTYGQHLILHSGGHEIPRDQVFVHKVASSLHRMINTALMG